MSFLERKTDSNGQRSFCSRNDEEFWKKRSCLMPASKSYNPICAGLAICEGILNSIEKSRKNYQGSSYKRFHINI